MARKVFSSILIMCLDVCAEIIASVERRMTDRTFVFTVAVFIHFDALVCFFHISVFRFAFRVDFPYYKCVCIGLHITTVEEMRSIECYHNAVDGWLQGFLVVAVESGVVVEETAVVAAAEIVVVVLVIAAELVAAALHEAMREDVDSINAADLQSPAGLEARPTFAGTLDDASEHTYCASKDGADNQE